MGTSSPTTIAAMQAVREMFESMQDRSTRLGMRAIAAATPDHSYSSVALAVRQLNKDGVLNSALDVENASNKVYWLRAKGEARRDVSARNFNGAASKPAAIKQADHMVKLQVLPQSDQMDDQGMWKLARAVSIETDGASLYVEFGGTRLILQAK